MRISSKQIFTNRNNKHYYAFTLIELLVVIGIIAVLSAILFPAFSKVRERARTASCASNQKQISAAIMQYIQDNDESYPVPTDWVRNWAQSIYPYVKSTRVFVCPSNPLAPRSAMWWQDKSTQEIPGSYAYNYHFGETFLWAGSAGVMTTSKVDSPSQKILIAEMTNDEAGIAWPNWTNPGSTRFKDDAFAGHNGMMNVAFADGHIRTIKPMKTVSPVNMWGQFDGQTASDGAGCDIGWNINCDGSNSQIISAFALFEEKYH